VIVHATSEADKALLLDWLAPRLDTTPRDLVWNNAFDVVGILRGNTIAGVILYNNWRGRSIEMHCAGSGSWLTPGVVRAVFTYPFVDLGCELILLHIKRGNRIARAFAEHLGFKMDGIKRAEERRDDMMMYGMLKSECRWLGVNI